MGRINLSEWALNHSQMIIFLLVLLSAAGIYSYTKLGQKEDPEFTIKVMVVDVRWPGSSAKQMSEQVTDRIERKLQEIAEIDYTMSYSRPGEAQVKVILREDVPEAVIADVWYRVRKKIGDIKGTFPSGVQGPAFNDEFGDTFGNLYAITGAGFTYPELRDFADQARNEFLRVKDVNKVEIEGDQDQKIYVEVSRAKLASLGLDPSAIASQLANTNSVEPSGIVNSTSERVRLDVTGEFQSVESIRSIGIRAGDRVFRLGDIAEVRRGVIDPPTAKLRYKGKEAVGLSVSMRKGGDVIHLGAALDETVKRVQASLPLGVEIAAVSDQPKVVKRSVSEFTHSLLEAVIIVLAVSFFSLGVRTGFVVALCIPLVLAMTFLCMYILGIELQRISLGALIIALGLLVDDAIIAVEMMALKLEQGWDRFRAATYAYTATAFPMLTGTLITAAGFLPIGFAKSSAGQYVFSLFQVVGISLALSWIVAVIFTPYLGFKLIPEMKHHEGHDEDAVYQRGFYAKFRAVVEWCLARRKLVIATTLGLFVGSVALFKTAVPQQFFPASDRPEIIVDFWMPEAATFAATEREVLAFEEKLKGDADIVAVTSYIGRGSPRFYLPLDVQSPKIAFAEMMVMTKDKEARARVAGKMRALFENDFPNVRGRVNPLENGPPVGYPVQFRVNGTDPAQTRAYADQLSEILRAHPNLRHVNMDWAERVKTMRIEVDQDKARALGMTSKQVSDALQWSLSGSAITQYREGDKAIDIVARLPEDERADLNSLKDARVYLGKGKFIPVSQVARLTMESEESVLWRRNRVPSVTVRADVEGMEGPDATASVMPKVKELEAKLPLGYSIEAGGATESSATAQKSIIAVVPVAVVVVLVLLMMQLQDMKKTALVLATAPLGLIGVAAILAAFRIPFGFVAMLGFIALFGMIIRNSVILVVQIDHDLERGLSLWDAIVESAVRRFRPIVLTALAAILAMIPLTRSTFWGPMAWAIMGGLFVATLLTLLFLPALYAAVYGASRKTDTAEEVIPQQAGIQQQQPKRRFAWIAAAVTALIPTANAIDLVGAYERALQADPTFAAAADALDAGREKAVQGRAMYLPRVSLSANAYSIRDHVEVNGALAAISQEDSSGRTYGGKLEASQPLYRPQSWAEGRQLKEQARLSETDFRQAQQDLIDRVTRAYLNVLLAEENLRVARAQAAALGEQFERAKARYEVGKDKAADFEDAQARRDSALATLIAAEATLDLRRTQFQEITGTPGVDLAALGARFVPVPPQPDSAAEWTSRALDANYGILVRRSRVEVAKHEVDKYKLAGRPSVDLVASYGDKGQSGGLSSLLYPDRQQTRTIGIQVSVPLYAGGSLDSKHREALAKRRQAEHELEQAQSDARVQARDAYLSVKSGSSRVMALDQAVTSARTSLDGTVAGRDVGSRTTLDVLDAQQRLYSAEFDRAQARHDYLVGRVKLALAAGQLDESELRALNAYLR